MSVDRGFTWMDDETVALIQIFKKEEIQQELNGSKRNFVVYERIARELAEVGFSRNAYQCREKIKRLRKEYQLAKYCFQNNITPKKPMKHFDLVDKVFNREGVSHNSVDLGLLNSDQEDELHFTFNHDLESDASNSCTGNETVMSQSILPGPSSHTQDDLNLHSQMKQNSPSIAHNDSNDTLLANGEQDFDCIDKDSPLDENESPWVPNVVLVENELENCEREQIPINTEKIDNSLDENGMKYFQATNQGTQLFGGSDGPPKKKRRHDSKNAWLKKMMDKVTDSFVKYQEAAETRFLERITHLEQERMKRDESMQRLWMEFEERRRKEEQEHELKMMSLIGQFIQQISGSDTSISK